MLFQLAREPVLPSSNWYLRVHYLVIFMLIMLFFHVTRLPLLACFTSLLVFLLLFSL